jgi:Rod binding domain-containing protein
MSWSVSACGLASKLAEQLEQQFSKINCSDPGEQQTVQNVRTLVAQTITTIDPDKPVTVSASGSMGYKDYSSKSGPYQSVDLKISPIHFSV